MMPDDYYEAKPHKALELLEDRRQLQERIAELEADLAESRKAFEAEVEASEKAIAEVERLSADLAAANLRLNCTMQKPHKRRCETGDSCNLHYNQQNDAEWEAELKAERELAGRLAEAMLEALTTFQHQQNGKLCDGIDCMVDNIEGAIDGLKGILEAYRKANPEAKA